MTSFTENLNTLQRLLNESQGDFIHFGNELYRFTKQSDISSEEIANFEKKYQIQLPDTFKTFLLTLGACTLFEDERGFAYEFYPPSQWESFTNEVFNGTGTNLFPKIVLVCYPNGGHQAGFITSQKDAFGTFYSDIPVEYWEEDTELMSFANWLNEEISLCLL